MVSIVPLSRVTVTAANSPYRAAADHRIIFLVPRSNLKNEDLFYFLDGLSN
jgi:hypothetical protein